MAAVVPGSVLGMRRHGQIERRSHVPAELFERDFASVGRPLVLAGIARDAFLERWSIGALREKLGAHEIGAECTRTVYVDRRPRRRMRVADLCDRIDAGAHDVRWRGAPRELDADPPPSDEVLPPSTHTSRRRLWLAPHGTSSSLHHDGDADNLNLQVAGRKRFILLAPRHVQDAYMRGTAESPIDPFAPDLRRFPRFADVEALEAALEPGDALFIPKFWLHAARAEGACVNINTWFRWEGARSPWDALHGTPTYYRALATASATLKRRGLASIAQGAGRLWRSLAPTVPAQDRSATLDPRPSALQRGIRNTA